MSLERVDVLEAHVVAVLDQGAQRGRVVDGSLGENEVLGLLPRLGVDVVVQDQEAVLTGDHGVLGTVLDTFAARQDHAEFACRVLGFEHPPLGGDLRADPDHEVLLAAVEPIDTQYRSSGSWKTFTSSSTEVPSLCRQTVSGRHDSSTVW